MFSQSILNSDSTLNAYLKRLRLMSCLALRIYLQSGLLGR